MYFCFITFFYLYSRVNKHPELRNLLILKDCSCCNMCYSRGKALIVGFVAETILRSSHIDTAAFSLFAGFIFAGVEFIVVPYCGLFLASSEIINLEI